MVNTPQDSDTFMLREWYSGFTTIATLTGLHRPMSRVLYLIRSQSKNIYIYTVDGEYAK